MKITNKTALNIYLKDNNILSVSLCVNSLVDDLTKLFIKPNIVKEESNADIILKIEKLTHKEEYDISIKDNKIIILGSDDLGLIFGIYSFLEDFLYVPPFYKIEGLSLINKDEINLENIHVNSYPKTRFRGWFINDEDLLGGFKTLGKRKVEYEYYNDVIHPDMIDMLAETVLRFKMNMIIPSTLVNIFAPYEDKLLEICSNRGLYLSQHHIEPLGLSKFGFEQYANDNGFDPSFSYVSNKENLLKGWKYYVKEWSKYPRVVFQLGLRGGTDRPVWASDKNVSETPEGRGKLISDAIIDQYNIVKEIYPYEINTTSTMWMEGAELLKGGYLKLPKEIMLVLSDIGMSQLFGNDFFEIERENDRNYGVYYHVAYWHTGPHLAEGTLPKKMDYAYKLIKQYKTNYYSMLNVANVKDLTFSIFMNSRLTWDNDYNLEDIYDEYTRLYSFEYKDELKNAIKAYYSSLGDVGENQYKIFCNKYNFSYHKYENLDFPVVSFNDGMFRSIIYSFYFEHRELVKDIQLRNVCVEGSNKMAKVIEMFTTFAKKIHPNYQIGFNEHWTYQSRFMNNLFLSGIKLYDATEECNKLNFDKAEILFNESSKQLENILKDRETFYVGEYKNWFNDERKINIKLLIWRIPEDLKRAKEVLLGKKA